MNISYPIISAAEMEKIMELLYDNTEDISSELEYTSEYHFLIAVLLSARATDVGVNKATKELFKKVQTPQEMLDLGEEELKRHISTIGLYKTKAKNIMALSARLVQKFNGKVPNTFEDLVSLAGIGTKSANVVLNVIFNQNTVGVDTHVLRLSNRLGICNTGNVKIIEKELLKFIAPKWHRYINSLFVLHGRYVCKARNPKCNQCVINKYCVTYKKLSGIDNK